MAINSRRKGKVGELSFVHDVAALFGWRGHRTQQRTGWSDGQSPDVEIDELPDVFFEIKRCERLNVARALAFAVRQCGRRCPVLVHRPNRSVNGWMLTVRLTDLPRLVHAYTIAADQEATKAPPPSAKESSAAIGGQGACCSGTRRAARASRDR